MIINQLENGVVEYVMENAIVRVHPGKLTKEEREAVLGEAMRKFYYAIQRQRTRERREAQLKAAPPTAHPDQR